MAPSLFFIGNLWVAIAINFIIGLLAWKMKYITRGGLFASMIIGVMVFLAFGWPGFSLLFLNFLATNLLARFSIRQMTLRNEAIDDQKTGPRSFGLLFVRGLIPLLFAIVFVLSSQPQIHYVCLLAFLASLASMLGDIFSTELGQLYGKRTYKLITLKRVKSGTRGAVSIEGSIAGASAILLFSVVSVALLRYANISFEHYSVGLRGVIVVIFAALIANYIESTLGGIFSQFSKKPSKLLLTFVGSALGGLLAVFFTNLPEG